MRSILAWLGLLGAAYAAPVPAVVPPGDPMSLKRPRLPVTGLPEALAQQPHRLLGSGGGPVVAAADSVLGTPLARDGASMSPWHGYFLLDARATARLGAHLDLTASAAAWQVSASSGYRALAAVKPGLTAHVYGDLVSLGAHPLHAELVTVDLGETTVGRGLLLERQLVEGVRGGLRWGALHLGYLVGGQTTYFDDDLGVARLGFGRWAELNWVRWQTGGRRQTHYLTLAGEVPALGPDWRLAWEGGLRLADSRGGQATAALVKLDWTPRAGWGAAQVHLGYQARFYHQGYSVYGDTASFPLAWFPTPQREETLATNALDYVEASDWYHQWSHTVVAETRAPLFTPHLRLDLDLEGRAWFFRDVQRPPRTRAWQTDFGVDPLPYAPDPRVELYGRLALALLPSLDRPDRLRLGVQNTFVGYRQSFGASGASAGSPRNNSWLDRRGWFLFGTVEVFL